MNSPLTVLTRVPKEPSPVAKAVGSQAAGPSPGTSWGPRAALLQGLPGGMAVEGDGVKQSLTPGSPCPATGGQGERGGSGTWLCTTLFLRPPWYGREFSKALSPPGSEKWGDLSLPPPSPTLQAGACARQRGRKAACQRHYSRVGADLAACDGW